MVLLLGFPHAVGATECLVGCLVQGISPFDEDGLAVWGDRGACDSSTVGCDVSALTYPSCSYQGALWASTSGSDGSTSCTCDICDPYPYSDTTSYMEDDKSLWSRIHCYLAASESSGYDVSPCVAAIADTGTLPCVDDVYESPTVSQFECEENGIRDLSDSASHEECNWDGDVRMVQELFPATSASSSTTATSVAVNTNSCLVGCLVQGISPFDDDSLAVWDNRGVCDSNTIGCEVSALTYPSTYYQGALWASSWGTDGSSGCTCNICDPYPYSDTTSYMVEEKSVWSRIHCYLAASEASGYDVSLCVAAIVDTGTLPCVDDLYEPPTVDQFDCEENEIRDVSDSGLDEECNWAGVSRSTDELFGGTRAPSPLPSPTAVPAATTIEPAAADNSTPVPSNTRDATTRPVVTSTDSPVPTTAPSLTSLSSTSGPQPGITNTNSPNPTPAASPRTSLPIANGPSAVSPDSTTAAPSGTSQPSVRGSTPALEVESVSCSTGSPCQDNLCCHPDTNTCGRKYTYCQERDFTEGPRCCSGVDGDSSESNVCLEDSICEEPEGLTSAEVIGVWVGIVAGSISIVGGVWQCQRCLRKR